MSFRDEKLDDSVRLEPMDEPLLRSQAMELPSLPPQKPGFWTSRWAMSLGVVLGLLATALAFAIAVDAVVKPPRSVPVTAHRGVTELNDESSTAFDQFDRAELPITKLSAGEREDFESIEAFMQELQTLAEEEDHEAFRTRVDFDRLYGRIELIDDLKSWNWVEKKGFRVELHDTTEVEPEWRRLEVVAVLTPEDDRATRIVYAYGFRHEESLGENLRFWLAREDDQWKLYDWEDLDLGKCTSEEWAAYARHVDESAWNGYLRWNDLLVESSEQLDAGDREQAKDLLRRAENERVPSSLNDYRWLLTGYLWQSLGESKEAERCFLRVTHPEQSPGAYYELMKCNRWSNPREALAYAEKYEQTVGLNNELCQTMASMHSQLNQEDAALERWRQVLRFEPTNVSALAAEIKALPGDRKQEFAAQLAKQDDPAELAAQVARYVGYQDDDAFQYLLDYLEQHDPKSARTAGMRGLAAELRGDHQQAAEKYREAFGLETDDEQQQRFVDSYLESALEAGQIVDAWENVPDAETSFHTFTDGYDDGYLAIAREELREIVAAYRKQEPTDPWGVYYQAQLALDQQDYQEVPPVLVAALDKMDDSEDEENQYVREALLRQLSEAWHRTLPVAATYEGLTARGASLETIAEPLKEQLRWEDLELLVLNPA